jgi:hypothetical protein
MLRVRRLTVLVLSLKTINSISHIDVSPIQYPGKCVVFHNERPYYLNQNSIYYIAGTGAASFLPYNLSAKTGTQGQQGAVSVHGFGIFHVGPDGIYLCMPSTDQIIGEDKKITGSFEPIFRGESVNDVPACWLSRDRQHLPQKRACVSPGY